MIDFSKPSKVVITCHKRLSPFLQEEVLELGFPIVRSFSTGIEIVASLSDCIRLNLYLRCASQVLYSLKTFQANRPDDVYDTLIHYPWEELLAVDGYFSVTSTVDHFTVNNSMFVNVRVKDAVVDRMLRETGKRPNSGSAGDAAVIHLFWREEDAELFLDTSGETLSRHGYRKIPGKAPMLESLAAATVMATNWDKKSPFVNPMCGSSTVAIEAALLASNRRPGLLRTNYSFMHFLGYAPDVYVSELKNLKDLIRADAHPIIIASDISEDAVEISRVNAQLAGIEDMVHFSVGDFETTGIPEGHGVIFFNPEYGERLGVISELELTYARIGDFMKNKCQGYTGFVFTGNLDLAKKIGLKASRRIEFFNSTIDCRLLRFDLYSGSKREPKNLLSDTENT
jgi:putative N6-adenine-specific DNA methylase